MIGVETTKHGGGTGETWRRRQRYMAAMTVLGDADACPDGGDDGYIERI